MRGELQRLRAEIAADRTAVAVQLRELEQLDLRADAAPGELTRAAVALHHGYSAVESILVRVARAIEGSAPDGPDWHQALLESMGLDIPNTRPAILSARTVAQLRRLLAFRHFFRHAYSVRLDGERLADLRRDVDLDPAGDVYVLGALPEPGPVTVGPSTLEVTGFSELFVARLRGEDGTAVAAATFGISGADSGVSLIALAPDDVTIAGQFSDGELQLDGEVYVPSNLGVFVRRGDPFISPPAFAPTGPPQ